MTYPQDEDNGWKQSLILDGLSGSKPEGKPNRPLGWLAFEEGLAAHQLVGKVTAYQGEDG